MALQTDCRVSPQTSYTINIYLGYLWLYEICYMLHKYYLWDLKLLLTIQLINNCFVQALGIVGYCYIKQQANFYQKNEKEKALSKALVFEMSAIFTISHDMEFVITIKLFVNQAQSVDHAVRMSEVFKLMRTCWKLNNIVGYHIMFHIFCGYSSSGKYSAEKHHWRVTATLSTVLLPLRSGLSFCIADLAQTVNGSAT